MTNDKMKNADIAHVGISNTLSNQDDIPSWMQQSTLDIMKSSKRWLLWRSEKGAGDKKPRKVPYYVNGNLRGKTDTPEDAAQLTDYTTAMRAMDNYTGTGFALGNGWQGIDLDSLSTHPENSDLVESIGGYREVSPSGDGVHFIGYGEQFDSLKQDKLGCECYTSGRYFTFTGKDARDNPLTDLFTVVNDTLRPRFKPSKQSSDTSTSTSGIKELADVLMHLKPELMNYDQWVSALMAAHHQYAAGEHEQQAINMIKLWSSVDAERYDTSEVDSKWKGFTKTDKSFTMENLREMAGMPRVDVTSMFGAAPPSQLRSWDDTPWVQPDNVMLDDGYPDSYEWGTLPKVYERFMLAQLNFWTANSAEIYAGLFVSGVACHVPPHVTVQSAPSSPRQVPLRSATAIVWRPGAGKTNTMHDVLGSKDGGTLHQWSMEIRNRAKVENAMKMAAGADKKQIPEKMLVPNVLLNSATIEGLVETVAANLYYKTPTSLVTAEMYNALCSAGAHHTQAYKSMSDPYKALLDGDPYSRTTRSNEITFPSSPFNLVYDTNYKSFSSWGSLEEFFGDGLAYRHNFFGSGRPIERVKSDVVDIAAINGWEQLQRRLHQLPELKLVFEWDAEVVTMIKDLTDKAKKYQEDSHLMGWVTKLEAKFVVTSACMFLASHLDLAMNGGVVEIPSGIQRDAMDYLTGFVTEHQRFYYHKMEMDGKMGERLRYYAAMIARKGLTELMSKDIYGNSAKYDCRNLNEGERRQLVRALYEAGFISPLKNRQSKGWGRVEDATLFEVNPMMHTVFASYLTEINEAHNVRVEKMNGSFKRRAEVKEQAVKE